MATDRRTFLETGAGAGLFALLYNVGRVVVTTITPIAARTIPRYRFNLLRFWR